MKTLHQILVESKNWAIMPDEILHRRTHSIISGWGYQHHGNLRYHDSHESTHVYTHEHDYERYDDDDIDNQISYAFHGPEHGTDPHEELAKHGWVRSPAHDLYHEGRNDITVTGYTHPNGAMLKKIYESGSGDSHGHHEHVWQAHYKSKVGFSSHVNEEIDHSKIPLPILKKRTESKMIENGYTKFSDDLSARWLHIDHHKIDKHYMYSLGWKKSQNSEYIHPKWEHPSGAHAYELSNGWGFSWDHKKI